MRGLSVLNDHRLSFSFVRGFHGCWKMRPFTYALYLYLHPRCDKRREELLCSLSRLTYPFIVLTTRYLTVRRAGSSFLAGSTEEKEHVQIKAENLENGLLGSARHRGNVHSQTCQPLPCGQCLAWAWIKPSPLLAPRLTGRAHRGAAPSTDKDLGLSPLLPQHHWNDRNSVL